MLKSKCPYLLSFYYTIISNEPCTSLIQRSYSLTATYGGKSVNLKLYQNIFQYIYRNYINDKRK